MKSPQETALQTEIKKLRDKIADLEMELGAKMRELQDYLTDEEAAAQTSQRNTHSGSRLQEIDLQEVTCTGDKRAALSNAEIQRYCRQLILPQMGVARQVKLKNSKILIVGVGGLGCPAAQYLVSAGCNNITLIDYDLVEATNLQRQVLHTEAFLFKPKVFSAKVALHQLNSHCNVRMLKQVMSQNVAMQLVSEHDVILDCTDNVMTRYLLNDACVLSNKPLVSGSALQMDGQLAVYNYKNSPCYRCTYPVPPAKESVTNCEDGGVLGAVCGVIGSMQALEAIKIVTGMGNVCAGRLIIYDGASSNFMNVNLREKRKECHICSKTPLFTQLQDYERFCGTTLEYYPLNLVHRRHTISPRRYSEFRDGHHTLIDVRSEREFEICSLRGAINVPLERVLDNSYLEKHRDVLARAKERIVVYCRRGNDSQLAVEHMLLSFPHNQYVLNLKGGLHAWHKDVDCDFPIY